jgi:antitoxin VapB
MPAQSTLFKSNRSQAVRLPKDIAFPDGVKKVIVRKLGKSRIITPVDALWLDFFAAPGCPDFPEREAQPDYEERESF